MRDEIERLYPRPTDLAEAMHNPLEHAHLATITAFLKKFSPTHLGSHAVAVSMSAPQLP